MIPASLQEIVDMLATMERTEKLEALISIADRFSPVPESVSTRPHDEANRVKECESEVFVFAVPRPEGTLDFEFDVLNRQGISAMALAVLMKEHVSGLPLDQVRQLPDEIVYELFGRELSMGKSMGLMGVVRKMKAAAG